MITLTLTHSETLEQQMGSWETPTGLIDGAVSTLTTEVLELRERMEARLALIEGQQRMAAPAVGEEAVTEVQAEGDGGTRARASWQLSRSTASPRVAAPAAATCGYCAFEA